MKNFKKVTIIIIATISVLFVANVFYLVGLYNSIKEQTLQTAEQCMQRANILEMIARQCRHLKVSGIETGVVELHLNVGLLRNGLSIHEYHQLVDSLNINSNFTQSLMSELGKEIRQEVENGRLPIDYSVLDSLFMDELNRVKIYPEKVTVLPIDSVSDDVAGMWCVPFSDTEGGEYIYNAYISSMADHVLYQMSGIVVTTFLIILVLSFAFWYLIHTVMDLRTLEDIKDDFTNNMTHELKTPIAIAYSANDVLLNYYDSCDREKQQSYLRVALDQLTRLSGLVETILSMSMERRKTMTLSKETIRVREVLSDLSNQQLIRAKKAVDIKLDVFPDDLTIEADATHFVNVMNNLIENSVKYSDENVEIVITVTFDTITIRDNGIGIAAKNLPLIFNKFYRVPQGNRHDVRGYGIGLYYVKTIVEKMGWSISVESRLGEGTEFTIKMYSDEK